MNATKILGMALIVAGALGLFFGAVHYTNETSSLHVGSLELTVKDKKTVNIPVWAGVGALVAGGALLFVPRRKFGA
jgi:multidrug transporter EmrE-like cation transporter